MTGRRIYSIITIVILMAILTGCGDGNTENPGYGSLAVVEFVEMTMSPVAAGPETQEEVRLVYSTGSLTKEEESVIFENMKTLHQNLELPEYVGEGIHMVSSQEWFEAMAVRLYEGSRYYALQKEEETLLSVQVYYDVSGKSCSNVMYQNTENAVTLLRQEGSVTQLVQTNVSKEGRYDGSFELWQIDSATGEIRSEQGTYAEGVVVGDYTVAVCSVQPGAAFDLWTNREGFAYETTTVTYDEEGENGGDADLKTMSPQNPTASSNPTATQKPTNSQRPATTQKPTATQKPTTPQAPQAPAPTQEPAPPDRNDDGGDNGGSFGGNSGSNSGGGGSTDSGSTGGDSGSSGSDSAGGDSGSSDSGSTGGDSGGSDSGGSSGDVDIEWSDDIL